MVKLAGDRSPSPGNNCSCRCRTSGDRAGQVDPDRWINVGQDVGCQAADRIESGPADRGQGHDKYRQRDARDYWCPLVVAAAGQYPEDQHKLNERGAGSRTPGGWRSTRRRPLMPCVSPSRAGRRRRRIRRVRWFRAGRVPAPGSSVQPGPGRVTRSRGCGIWPGSSVLWLARAPCNWLREQMASLVKTLCRWYSTVRGPARWGAG
jgi:hypothetical protein